MTLLNAPEYDEARARRNQRLTYGSIALVVVLIVGSWFASGRPVDWPWNWSKHFFGRHAVNTFLTAVEQNDLPKAYGIWMHDKDWQKHPDKFSYTFDRFQRDWSASSPDNEYGPIRSHKLVAERMWGNVLLTESFINERKSKSLALTYEPQTSTLNFAPEDVHLYLGP